MFHRVSWLCLLLLVGVLPLVMWTDTDDTVRTPQWVFFWIVSAAGWACLLLSRRGRPAPGSPLSIPLQVYAGGAVILPFFAFRFSTAVMENLGILAGIAAATLAAEWLGKPGRARRAGALLVVSSLAITAYGFLQYMGFDRFKWAYQYGGMRPFATLGNPNFLGGHFAVLLAWATTYFLSARTAQSRAGWFCVAVLWGMLVLVSQTRGSWLAAGAALAFVLAVKWRTGRNELVAQGPLLAGAAGIAILVIIGFSASNSQIAVRAGSIVNPEFGQLAKRATAAKAAALMWREHPVFGIGPGCFKHGYGMHMAVSIPRTEMRQFVHTYSEEYCHSDPIQLLAESGVAGWGIFAWLVACALRLLRRPGRDDVMATAIMAGGVALLVHGSFNLPLHIAPTVFLFWMGIGASARPTGQAPGPVPVDTNNIRPAIAGVAGAVALAAGVAGALIFASSVYSRKGGDYVKFSRWAEAQWFYERAARVNWNERREMFFIASMMFQRGEFGGSLPYFERELVRNPYFMDGYANMGAALGASGNVPGAEQALRRATELNPAYAEAYANLGVALLQQKRYMESATSFQQALELDPEMELAQRGLVQAQEKIRDTGQ